MTNDPRDLSGARLQTALRQLGRHPQLRASVLALLKRAESQLDYAGPVRDDITGTIADALHDDADTYEKTLADGTRFKFLYRTKIAREFLLADDECPTHVWEPQTTRLLLHLCRDLHADALVGGAYFGDQAILLARALQGASGSVHCFEPNHDQADMLQHNARLNHLDNVRINRCGLWHSSDARLKLDGFDSFANAISARADDPQAFSTISIDDYRAAHGLTLGLLQLDIEGAELSALQGARQTLAEDRPHVVFEVHRDYVDWSHGLAQTDICRYLAEFGYSIHALRDFNSHREMGNKPIELVPLDQVYLDGPAHGFNMVAVMDPAHLPAPLFKRVAHVSPKLLAHKNPALHHPLDGL